MPDNAFAKEISPRSARDYDRSDGLQLAMRIHHSKRVRESPAVQTAPEVPPRVWIFRKWVQMRYLVSFNAIGRDVCRELAETPVGAIRAAIQRKDQGFVNIRLWDSETGADYSAPEFAKVHDLSILMEASKPAWEPGAALAS